MNYLGIDLGTANTYFYEASQTGLPKPLALPGLSDATGSMATVVLYEKARVIAAGNIAEAEFYSQPGLQGKRRLASQFKPELALADGSAMQAATDFLRLAREALPGGKLQTNTVITVGMPALAREDYPLNLRECFRAAGWPEPDFARESDAALVSCLQSGALSADDIGRKCLIVDFGGGTCDYTSVESLDVLQNGGDILYGGRLFDDLIYQAFLRANSQFARDAPKSPYAWHAHWLECREQKERFSDFLNSGTGEALTLRIAWFDARGKAHEAFLQDYDKTAFLRDAENYSASPELLAMLAPYARRGGLSQQARDLLAGRQVGLLSWFKAMLEGVERRREVSCVILTGGSSRWFFVAELTAEIFPAARCVPSGRGYEDIAFGLAIYPRLAASQKKAALLLHEQLGDFTRQAVARANGLVEKQTRQAARLLGERIVARDILPALEAAQQESLTIAELERSFVTAIENDEGLVKIVEERSQALAEEVGHMLNYAFRHWLADNGVPLAPSFSFPAYAIGQDFFRGLSVKVMRLDSLNLMAFTLQNVLPILVGTATAGAIAPSTEPVSTVAGGGLAFGLTWLLAKTAPKLLARRKLPSFILTENNRKKIAARNREHIEAELLRSFAIMRKQMEQDIENRLKTALTAMVGSLTALNQVKPF